MPCTPQKIISCNIIRKKTWFQSFSEGLEHPLVSMSRTGLMVSENPVVPSLRKLLRNPSWISPIQGLSRLLSGTTRAQAPLLWLQSSGRSQGRAGPWPAESWPASYNYSLTLTEISSLLCSGFLWLFYGAGSQALLLSLLSLSSAGCSCRSIILH